MNNVFSRDTPYDDTYGTCAETRAELLIYPDAMLPEDVTRRLGIKPSETATAGQEQVNSLGRKRIARSTFWSLSSEGEVRSMDLRRHLDWLLGRLATCGESLVELQSVRGVRMRVNCVWYSKAGHGGPTLWPEQMRAMADLNLECSFDIYFLPDDHE